MNRKNIATQLNDSDLWQMNEVDEALRELPNAESVLDMLNTGQLDRKRVEFDFE